MCRVIDLVKTGKNIERLLAERGLTAKDVQQRLGFAERRPVYFWIAGKNLPSIDNLFMREIEEAAAAWREEQKALRRARREAKSGTGKDCSNADGAKDA